MDMMDNALRSPQTYSHDYDDYDYDYDDYDYDEDEDEDELRRLQLAPTGQPSQMCEKLLT